MWRKLWFNSPGMKLRRQELRNKATRSERLLWLKLKKSQLGVKFIRQYSINNWVVDFYCPSKKLVIEVDGFVHNNNKLADGYRDRFLSGMGLVVLRVKNKEIEAEMDDVIRRIMGVVNITYPAPPS